MAAAEPTTPPIKRRRISKTRWTVRLMDRLSRLCITVAGIGTILAVLTVFIFLICKVVPIFLPGHVLEASAIRVPSEIAEEGKPLAAAGIDENGLMIWTLSSKGIVTVFRRENGEVLERRELFKDSPPTSVSVPNIRSYNNEKGVKVTEVQIAFGFKNGSFRTGKFTIQGSYADPRELPEAARKLEINESTRAGEGMVLFTPEKQYFLQKLEVVLPEADDPPSPPSPIRLIDQTEAESGPVVCTLSENNKLRLYRVTVEKPPIPDPDNPGTVKVEAAIELPYDATADKVPPDHLLLSQHADQLVLIWNDGRLIRYDTRKPQSKKPGEAPLVAERMRLFDRDTVRVTAVRQLIGRSTILIGDSTGTLSAWFPIKPSIPTTADGVQLVRGHRLEGPNAAITSLDVSSRGRMVCAGYSDGQVSLVNVTSHKRVADVNTDSKSPIQAVIVSPKVDSITSLTGTEGKFWKIEPGHSTISLASVFTKVWYEGYEAPVHKWESSSGHDSYEPKYGLVPLIFGTIKASFYALLFGVPLALLAAIYTSEFMRPRAKAIVKPTIEMMASLPSVVLGFLAGLVFAQFVEDKVVTILCCFLFVPLAFILVAQLAQLLPEKTFHAVTRIRFLAFLLCLPLGVLAAWLIGPIIERVFFEGDLRKWVVDRNASSVGGWMLLFVPLSVLGTALLMGNMVTPWVRRLTAKWNRYSVAMLDLLRFVGGCTIAVGIALAASQGMAWLELDARGNFLGTYDQRNALIAGFAMGFAIIPIIYTIAEDALSSVPQHLRSGSLATGATQWQTAVRIVIPTAMSGLFSAIMIGFGRAIGETMIVVMASGNTPLMDWNLFNGFRTLSANIAVEIPEAEQQGTLFGTLFLAALVLFLMTFTLNTIAEIVRLRFRKRAYQL